MALVTNGNNLNIVRADGVYNIAVSSEALKSDLTLLAPLPRESKPKFRFCRFFKLNYALAFLFVVALYSYIYN
jgi:hypothetical protein